MATTREQSCLDGRRWRNVLVRIVAVAVLAPVPACFSLSLISEVARDDAGAPVDDGASTDAAGDVLVDVDAGIEGGTPLLVGSRLTLSSTTSLVAGSVAGVKEGDLLVAAWMGPLGDLYTMPTGWTELGRGTSSWTASGAGHLYWVGYHVVDAVETEATTYTFSDNYAKDGQAVAMIAYRGTRAVQPVNPAFVGPMYTQCTDGGNTTAPAAVVTRGRSVTVYVIGYFTYSPPNVPGLDRPEALAGLGIYRTPSPVPDGTEVVRPDFGAAAGCSGFTYFSASLGIVGAP